MKVTKTKNADKLLVSVEGRIDTVTAKQFEEETVSALGGVTELTLDFTQLNYISSAGLRVLLLLQKNMNKQGSMKVTGVNETVKDIFEVTGFSEILTVE